MIQIASFDSALGPLAVAAHGARVCGLWFGKAAALDAAVRRWYPGEPIERAPDPAGALSALERYFAGELDVLDEVPVELNGTPFQRRVWERLRTVRAGATASYSDIARAIGIPAAVRAVGAANGSNPVAIIVPCHRIIGLDGRLTGYGGGLERKRWLLDHEHAAKRLPFGA